MTNDFWLRRDYDMQNWGYKQTPPPCVLRTPNKTCVVKKKKLITRVLHGGLQNTLYNE